jgi:hypothetical protein
LSARSGSDPRAQRVYAAWEFRDGKALRGGTYQSREDALEAAGLREAMSEENVEALRRGYEAVNRGDDEL